MQVEVPDDNVFTLSPLERLPRDLLWKILRITPESILEVRLVSNSLPWQYIFLPIKHIFLENVIIRNLIQTCKGLKSCVDELALMRGIMQLEGPLIIGSQYRQPYRVSEINCMGEGYFCKWGTSLVGCCERGCKLKSNVIVLTIFIWSHFFIKILNNYSTNHPCTHWKSSLVYTGKWWTSQSFGYFSSILWPARNLSTLNIMLLWEFIIIITFIFFWNNVF